MFLTLLNLPVMIAHAALCVTAGSALHPDYLSHGGVGATHVDELDLPDLLHQLHGGVAVDEEGLGVVSQLQRLQPLCHRRGVVAVVADGPHLRGERRRSGVAAMVFLICFFLAA